MVSFMKKLLLVSVAEAAKRVAEETGDERWLIVAVSAYDYAAFEAIMEGVG